MVEHQNLSFLPVYWRKQDVAPTRVCRISFDQVTPALEDRDGWDEYANKNITLSLKPDRFSKLFSSKPISIQIDNICYSLCNTTIAPIIPSMTVFNHGCSLSMIVT